MAECEALKHSPWKQLELILPDVHPEMRKSEHQSISLLLLTKKKKKPNVCRGMEQSIPQLRPPWVLYKSMPGFTSNETFLSSLDINEDFDFEEL